MNPEGLARHDDAKHRWLVDKLEETGTPQSFRLAKLLSKCSRERPCLSGACIYCGRDFQRLSFDFVQREMRDAARRDVRGRMSAITIVSTLGCFSADGLTAASCRRVMTDVSEKLVALGICTFALSLDISFNEDETAVRKPYWCAHVHGVLPDWYPPTRKEKITAAFPASRLVSQPTFLQALDNCPRGVLYVFKPDRCRRVAFLDHSDPHRRPFKNAKPRPLRPSQAVRLAHVEHELSYSIRLVTAGLDESAVDAVLKAFYRIRDGP